MRHTTDLKKKSKSHEVQQTGPARYTVTSGHTGSQYEIAILENGASCTCDWAKYRPVENGGRSGCSHVLAVLAYIESENGRTISAFETLEQAGRQHRPIADIGDGLVLTTRNAAR
jgi:hypothetical protein